MGVKAGIFGLLGLVVLGGCGGEDLAKAPEATVLARVDGRPITDADFDAALKKLQGGDEAAASIEDWRRQFQLLVDRELLLLEARAQGLHEDAEVLRRMRAWERSYLTERLVAARLGEALDEAAVAAFFKEQGGAGEIRVRRRRVEDRKEALAVLQAARRGSLSAEAEDLGWLNPLETRDPRLGVLFGREAGAVELVEAAGAFEVLEVAQTRRVGLDERRQMAREALLDQRRAEANMAFLEELTTRYEVGLDTAGVGRLAKAGDVGTVVAEMRLVHSALGDWTVGDFARALEDLGQGGQVPRDVAALSFQVTRAYVVSRLLEPEARRQELAADFEARRRQVLQRELVDALFRRHALDKVGANQAEMRAYYEARKGRYEGIEGPQLGARVAHDLRQEKAAPLFEAYLEELRRRHADKVAVDEEAFGAFVAGKRRGQAPVDM